METWSNKLCLHLVYISGIKKLTVNGNSNSGQGFEQKTWNLPHDKISLNKTTLMKKNQTWLITIPLSTEFFTWIQNQKKHRKLEKILHKCHLRFFTRTFFYQLETKSKKNVQTLVSIQHFYHIFQYFRFFCISLIKSNKNYKGHRRKSKIWSNWKRLSCRFHLLQS